MLYACLFRFHWVIQNCSYGIKLSNQLLQTRKISIKKRKKKKIFISTLKGDIVHCKKSLNINFTAIFLQYISSSVDQKQSQYKHICFIENLVFSDKLQVSKVSKLGISGGLRISLRSTIECFLFWAPPTDLNYNIRAADFYDPLPALYPGIVLLYYERQGEEIGTVFVLCIL